MKRLNREFLRSAKLSPSIKVGRQDELPVKVMQFGEGNFMRAFIDWMFDELNSKNLFNGAIQLVQPIRQGIADFINEQDGLYTLLLRGVKDGKVVEQQQIITSVKGCLNPYEQWQKTVDCACSADLRFIFSNTTEAGISYAQEKYVPGQCPETFPAKIAALLYQRFCHFKGAADKGLIVVPCELIDKNGATLREYILRYAADWQLGNEFTAWVRDCNFFVNTLVDRIVAGYPRQEIAAIQDRLGYEDKLVDCGEIFHFFVIEGPQKLSEELPFHKIGLDVVWTDNQTPYRTRKVRFLNGAHTSSVLAAHLGGLDLVDEMMDDKVYGAFVERAIKKEIYHTVDLPDAEKTFFADSVLERFRNPFAGHQLISISLNSTSKWKVRVLPSLLDYVAMKKELPPCLAFSMAALICFYDCRKQGDKYLGFCRSNPYPVSDDLDRVEFFAAAWTKCEQDKNYRKLAEQVLAMTAYWEMDLNQVPGMTDYVTAAIESIKASGMRAAMRKTLGL